MADSLQKNGTEREGIAITEILPKNGLVYSEKANLSEVLCKPKLMPIKSISLQKLEQLEEAANASNTKSDANNGT